VLQSLLASLLAACGDDRDAELEAKKLAEDLHIPYDLLEEHLSLLNLVNFGGGCYAVYAELHEAEVHVDKELFGDTFRSAPRLTPLEARAIRLALEFVGPLIAAGLGGVLVELLGDSAVRLAPVDERAARAMLARGLASARQHVTP